VAEGIEFRMTRLNSEATISHMQASVEGRPDLSPKVGGTAQLHCQYWSRGKSDERQSLVRGTGRRNIMQSLYPEAPMVVGAKDVGEP